MSTKTLYEVLAAMTPSLRLPTTCRRACKRTQNSLASGCTEERMG